MINEAIQDITYAARPKYLFQKKLSSYTIKAEDTFFKVPHHPGIKRKRIKQALNTEALHFNNKVISVATALEFYSFLSTIKLSEFAPMQESTCSTLTNFQSLYKLSFHFTFLHSHSTNPCQSLHYIRKILGISIKTLLN